MEVIPIVDEKDNELQSENAEDTEAAENRVRSILSFCTRFRFLKQNP